MYVPAVCTATYKISKHDMVRLFDNAPDYIKDNVHHFIQKRGSSRILIKKVNINYLLFSKIIIF